MLRCTGDGIGIHAMELAQYYYPDETLTFDPSLYNFSSEPPMVPQQNFESSPAGLPPNQLAHRMEDGEFPTQKETTEEADASSRPRLTTEQTNVLEEHFRREAKPVTEVKRQLAAQVGLPLDKVNVSIDCNPRKFTLRILY